jgi:C1A family cysteine protease
MFSDYGWNVYTNEGGIYEMGLGYLTSWLGPVLEENDEFDDFSVLSPLLNSIMHVQNVVFLKRNNALDNDGIKEAILKYGEKIKIYKGLEIEFISYDLNHYRMLLEENRIQHPL